MTQSTAGHPNPALGDAEPDIDRAIARLRALTQHNPQPQWRCCAQNMPLDRATQAQPWDTWEAVELNERHHIAWERGYQVRWLGLWLQVPDALEGYPLAGLTLRLALTWWAESAQVYVDGQLVEEGDIFDCSARVLLREAVQPGEAIAVALRLVSPGHDDGALVQSRCIYERPAYGLTPCPEPGFVADELAVLQRYARTLMPDALTPMAAAVQGLDWDQVSDRPAFDQQLMELRDRLLPLGNLVKQRQITLLGHAHLDLAWLWPVAETWVAAERTFESVLQLQAEFPELIFSHSSPALYAWVEENRPALFAAIQRQVAAGRWEVAAGLWVEPEFNTVSGESLARQVLYGQRYVQEKFGRESAIAWLPDSFGFAWQLPQILQQGGVRYFVTQKLRWNECNPFPHEAFLWQAPDGTPIFSLHSAPIGEGIDPIKMADYACQWEQKTELTEALWLFGVGDHGGGPTRDMLHLAHRWQRSPFFPQLTFGTAEAFLDRVQGAIAADRLPRWTDELYLEFHRGCYTTHGDQKAWNTQCEVLLQEAELWGAIAAHFTAFPYPAQDLETAWKRVLFNQFHDILPGSAVTQVYIDANREWEAAAATAHRIRQQALAAIAPHITLPTPPQPNARPLLVFNGLNWTRSESVMVDLPPSQPHGQVWDLAGKPVATQWSTGSDTTSIQLCFQAEAVPGVGYRLFWLTTDRPVPAPAPDLPDPHRLENEFLRIQIDPQTGFLTHLFDKRQGREVLNGIGNELQVFQDKGQYWDAWNIAPDYEQQRLPGPELVTLESAQWNGLELSMGAVWQLGQSRIEQRYRLPQGATQLIIDTVVDWQETHVLLKVAFPVAVVGDRYTHDIPFGAITHPTQPVTPEDCAKWEVPALRWVDLSDADYGVSLLTGYKHGVDVKPGQIRLSLLRSPCFPNPLADRGLHHFTYALVPHAGSWETSQIVQRAYALNQPMVAMLGPEATPETPSLPPVQALLTLSAENLILTALKPSEADPHTLILRCYECIGQAVEWVGVEGAIAPSTQLHPVSLLETSLGTPGDRPFPIHPWQICTWQIIGT